MKNAALLLRVSTDIQDIDSQKEALLPVAKSMGYNVSEEWIFGQHITGKDDIRKGERVSIKKLKELCKTGIIDVIIIWEVSRLSRSGIAGRQFIQDFNEMKIPIYFKDRNIWTLNPDTLEEDVNSKMIIGLYLDIAESELKTLKDRTDRGKRKNVEHGLSTGGFQNYGYKVNPETNKIEIDEEEAKFVRDLFAKYASGKYSTAALTKYANTTSYLPRYNKTSRKGNFRTNSGRERDTSTIRWGRSVITKMLHNRRYIGERVYKDMITKVPAIVDEETFNKAQTFFKKNPNKIEKAKKYIHLLGKKVVCGQCGNSYYSHVGITGSVYLCTSYSSKSKDCDNIRINYEKSEAVIWDYLKNYSYYFKKIDETEKERITNEIDEKKQELLEQQLKINQLIDEENVKVRNLLNLVKNSGGAFKMEDIIQDKINIDREIANYNIDLNKIHSELALLDNRLKQIVDTNLTDIAIERIEADRNQMKKIIDSVIDVITVYKAGVDRILLQVELYGRVVNILMRRRVKVNCRYCFIDNSVAEFQNPMKYEKEMLLPSEIVTMVPVFDVTSNNNEVFDEDIFGGYSFDEMWDILIKYGCYRDYTPLPPVRRECRI